LGAFRVAAAMADQDQGGGRKFRHRYFPLNVVIQGQCCVIQVDVQVQIDGYKLTA
jgi:hypothetical protein